jgi:hypothetical protein
MKEFFKYILLGILVVLNTAFFIAAAVGFLYFIASIVYAADIAQIFKYFMIGFIGLLFGTIVYDCVILLCGRIFR